MEPTAFPGAVKLSGAAPRRTRIDDDMLEIVA
jgi:hypothetical protein